MGWERGSQRGRGEGVGSCGGGVSRFGFVMEGAERDLRRVEDLAAFFGWYRADEYAVRGASDEVADAFVAGKQGHGVAIRLVCLPGREEFVQAFSIAIILHVSIEGTPPCGAATPEGRSGVCWIRVGLGGRRAHGRRCWDGFDQGECCCGCSGHSWILPMDSVRGLSVIFCKPLRRGHA